MAKEKFDSSKAHTSELYLKMGKPNEVRRSNGMLLFLPLNFNIG